MLTIYTLHTRIALSLYMAVHESRPYGIAASADHMSTSQ